MKNEKITVVAGVDFSEESRLATDVAVQVARRKCAELVLVHVGDPRGPAFVMPPDDVMTERDEKSLRRLEDMQRRLSDQGVTVSHKVVDDVPAEGLCNVASDLNANLVVVGNHGRTGSSHFLLGSVAERTARLCACSTMVVRPGSQNKDGFQKILVPTDFTAFSEAALREALEFAAEGAKIDLVHYWTSPATEMSPWAPALREKLRSEAEAQGQTLLSKYQNDRVVLSFAVVESHTASGIIDHANAAESTYDLIVMGSHGRHGVRRFLLGTNAERVLRHAPCSVLIVRRDDNSAE